MDNVAQQLLGNMKELSAMFNDRMSKFEKNLQLPGTKETNTTVKSLAAEFTSFKAFVWKSIGLLQTQIELLVQGMDRLDTHSRRKVLLLHGIKEHKDEDILKTTLAVLSDQMKLSSLGSGAIESCHRLGSKKASARPVLVRFGAMQHRALVWKAKTLLKGTKVTITEFLTKSRQEIFTVARGHFGIKKSWTAEGTVVILLPDNTRKKVFAMKDLQQLIIQYPKCTTQAPDEKTK